MSRRVLGIDPGLTSGAAAIIEIARVARPVLIDAIDIPTYGEDARKRIDERKLWRWAEPLGPDEAFVERAQAMPEQGVSSVFKYGRAVGAIEATIHLMNVSLRTVEPAVWKRALGLGTDKTDSVALARALFDLRDPEILSLQKHHNRAEAALMALYGSGAAFWRPQG